MAILSMGLNFYFSFLWGFIASFFLSYFNNYSHIALLAKFIDETDYSW